MFGKESGLIEEINSECEVDGKRKTIASKTAEMDRALLCRGKEREKERKEKQVCKEKGWVMRRKDSLKDNKVEVDGEQQSHA